MHSVIVAGPVPVKVTPPARSSAGLFGGGTGLIIPARAMSNSPPPNGITSGAIARGGIGIFTGARASTVMVNEAASAVEISVIAERAASASLRVLDSFMVCSLIPYSGLTGWRLALGMPTFMVLI